MIFLPCLSDLKFLRVRCSSVYSFVPHIPCFLSPCTYTNDSLARHFHCLANFESFSSRAESNSLYSNTSESFFLKKALQTVNKQKMSLLLTSSYHYSSYNTENEKMKGVCETAVTKSKGVLSSADIHRIKVPSMGDSITEGVLMKWTKKVGDIVKEDEILCVIETDKISVDIHADCSGKIIAFATEAGGTVYVGGDLASLDLSYREVVKEEKQEKACFDKINSPSKISVVKRSNVYVPLISFERGHKQKMNKNLKMNENKIAETRDSELYRKETSSTVVKRYDDYGDLECEYKPSLLSEEEIAYINHGILEDSICSEWIAAMTFYAKKTKNLQKRAK